ncbi:hypothetical protein WBK31_26365 [Nonomuraea sp. N2-4H]|uniref:hypothetical protein n=1 Tax=Nonomuraea sp. N2-4H TaxID=3128898 RepID=UPI00325516F6
MADVPLDVTDSLTLIGLIRALVVTALGAVRRGDRGLPVPGEVLRAAYWRAARYGLQGEILDVRDGTLVPGRGDGRAAHRARTRGAGRGR